MNTILKLGVAAVIMVVAGCLPAGAAGEEGGYFLSWKQKRELMALGRIQDSAGIWYDVWICPGYVPPATYARDSFKRAGSNFGEYFHAEKYQSLKAGSTACMDWALKDCGLGFTVKGIPRAWGSNFRTATERTRRRVFGWWLAYPWACFESTVETAFRGALGTVGTAGGLATGLAVVPAYHVLNSAVAGVWNLGVNTVVIPTAGLAWNTVVSPPLAFIGQKPSTSRVDGFWVTVVNAGQAPATRSLTPEEVRGLSQWGLLLLKETKPFAEKQEQVDNEANEKQRALYRQMERVREETRQTRARITAEEHDHVSRLVATNGMAAAGADAWALGRDGEVDIRRYLTLQHIPQSEVNKVIELMRIYRSIPIPAPATVRNKTDPLQRSVEVIENTAEDVIK